VFIIIIITIIISMTPSYRSIAGRSAANPLAAAATVDRWNRQPERRTPERYVKLFLSRGGSSNVEA